MTMQTKFKLCVVQFNSPSDAIEDNFARFVLKCEEAVKLKADIVVFPEYLFQGDMSNHTHLADDGSLIKRVCEVALRLKLDIVPGTIVEAVMENGYDEPRLLNTAYYVDGSTGKVLGR